MRKYAYGKTGMGFQTPNAFTLIEVLVVITIVAILLACLMPMFLSMRAKSYQIQCLSNLKQIGTAFYLYADEHDGLYPEAWVPDPAPIGTRWHDKLLTYLSGTNVTTGKAVLVCPSARVNPILDYNVYKKNQWPATLAVKYNGEVVLVFDGTQDNLPAADSSNYGSFVTNRHSGVANYLFGDGHVMAMSGSVETNWVLR